MTPLQFAVVAGEGVDRSFEQDLYTHPTNTWGALVFHNAPLADMNGSQIQRFGSLELRRRVAFCLASATGYPDLANADPVTATGVLLWSLRQAP